MAERSRPRARSIRARLLAWYVVLLAVVLGVVVVTLRQVLMTRLDDEIDSALAQEVAEFRIRVEQLQPGDGTSPAQALRELFRDFVAGNVPGEGEALYTFVGDTLVSASPGAPRTLLDDAAVSAALRRRPDTTWGESATEAGHARWLAVPVDVNAGDRTAHGAFLVANFHRAEREEIDQMVRVLSAIAGGALVVAAAVAWMSASRVVRPVRDLTAAARTIQGTDLSARMDEHGDDELAELARTFNAMLDRLEVAFASQRQMLDDIGHELRTPITIIQGHLELLPDDPLERAATISLCLDELDRMHRYVADLTLLARAERPDFLRIGDVDLADVVDDLQSRARAAAPDRRWVIEAVAPVVVRADRDRLHQACINLAVNAAQHTAPGDEIRLGSSCDGHEARIWVHDSGPGIDPADQARIFERFGRGAGATTRRPEGTGLGLAIVAAVARAHGGRVELDSAPGRGARFTIVLPIAQPVFPPPKEALAS